MTAPPKRRWFRFGLRTMFVVVTFAAMACWLVPVAYGKYRSWRLDQQILEKLREKRTEIYPPVGVTAPIP